MNETTQKVRSLYNQFPYPLKPLVVEQPYRLHLLNFWNHLPPEQSLKDDLQILIAGCGTNEAINTALSFPNATITAIDLSQASLDIAQKMAANFKLKNIEFLQADILNLPKLGSFDYISSFGVLHHLSDPVQGLQNLVKQLKDDGVIELMLYSETHRYFIQRIQRLVNILAGSDQSADQKMKIAREFIHSATPGSWPFGVYFDIAKMRDLYERSVPEFADTFVHPQEVGYNYPQLLDFLNSADLCLENFSNPAEWEITPNIYENAFLENRFENLPRDNRFEIVDMLNGPLYIFFARKNMAKRVAPHLSDPSWLLQSRPFTNRVIHHHMNLSFELIVKDELKINITQNIQNKDFLDIEFNGQKATDNRILADILPLADGAHTGEQITQLLAEKYNVTFEQILNVSTHLMRLLYQLKIFV